MYRNSNYQHIYNEDDIVTGWLSGIDISEATVNNLEPINIYNAWCDQFDNSNRINAELENTSNDYVNQCIENWHMPDEYKDLDIVRWLNNRPLTYEQRDRLHMEIEMFRERGMIPVLRFLRYLVDVCNENNIVLGVGRGSSVASYVLYLIGIHKIDSIKYGLDIKEFLK